MQEKSNLITPDCQVTLHYSLTLADGTEVVSTFDEDPLCFCMGDGTMVEALEQCLIGLARGAKEQIILSGDDAFGPKTDEKIQRISRNEFPDKMAIAAGQVIAFTTPGGDELAGQVLEFDDESVLIDFNHPLSGHAIMFRIKILEINPQSGSLNMGN